MKRVALLYFALAVVYVIGGVMALVSERMEVRGWGYLERAAVDAVAFWVVTYPIYLWVCREAAGEE